MIAKSCAGAIFLTLVGGILLGAEPVSPAYTLTITSGDEVGKNITIHLWVSDPGKPAVEHFSVYYGGLGGYYSPGARKCAVFFTKEGKSDADFSQRETIRDLVVLFYRFFRGRVWHIQRTGDIPLVDEIEENIRSLKADRDVPCAKLPHVGRDGGFQKGCSSGVLKRTKVADSRIPGTVQKEERALLSALQSLSLDGQKVRLPTSSSKVVRLR